MFARIVRFSSRAVSRSVRSLALLMLAAFAQYAFAQWTYRVAPEPYVRNIVVFANTPSAGTNTLIVSTLTDGMYKVIDASVSLLTSVSTQGGWCENYLRM